METTQRMLLTSEYESMMALAQRQLPQSSDRPEVVVVKTTSGALFFQEIDDYADAAVRESLENKLLQKLSESGQSQVRLCLVTLGKQPEVPSWNLLTGLIALHPDNLETKTFLWGGGENIHVRPLRQLLPPKKDK
jgi:hypothetical protein